jgi:hypothetical protein
MSPSDFLVWLILVCVSVLIFFVLPISDGLSHLSRSGLKLIVAGVPIIIKLFHSVLSDQRPKSK